MPTADAFEAPQGQPFHGVLLRAITESLAGNGVVNNGDFEVTATATDLQISVAAGTMYYLASEHSLGSAATFTLTAGDGTYDRWDTVYFDTATDSAGVHEGTPAQYPEPPDVAGDEMLLAVVHVAQGATNITDAEILNWRPGFSNGAAKVRYDDSPGVYGVSTVDGALDELQEAAQLSAYPLAPATDLGVAGYPFLNSDLANSSVTVAGNAVGLGGTTTVDHADLANIGSGDHHTRYTDEEAQDAVGVMVDATLAYDDATPALGVATGSVTTTEVLDGTLLDADIDPATTIDRGKLDTDRDQTAVTAAHTTAGEDTVLADTSGGAFAITLATTDVVAGRSIRIVDAGGTAGTNNISITTEGGESLVGPTATTISINNGYREYESDGTGWFEVAAN